MRGNSPGPCATRQSRIRRRIRAEFTKDRDAGAGPLVAYRPAARADPLRTGQRKNPRPAARQKNAGAVRRGKHHAVFHLCQMVAPAQDSSLWKCKCRISPIGAKMQMQGTRRGQFLPNGLAIPPGKSRFQMRRSGPIRRILPGAGQPIQVGMPQLCPVKIVALHKRERGRRHIFEGDQAPPAATGSARGRNGFCPHRQGRAVTEHRPLPDTAPSVWAMRAVASGDLQEKLASMGADMPKSFTCQRVRFPALCACRRPTRCNKPAATPASGCQHAAPPALCASAQARSRRLAREVWRLRDAEYPGRSAR